MARAVGYDLPPQRARGNRVARIRQQRSVVLLLIARRSDRDGTLRDFQLAVHDHKLDVREVLAGVLEIRRYDAQLAVPAASAPTSLAV